MGLMPEGIKLVIVGLAGVAASFFLFSYSKILGIPFIAVFSILTLFSLYFFRDPKRDAVFSDNQIACPADGTVMSLKEEGDYLVLRIFLSVFNVHIQRAPFSGKITKINFVPGKFKVAYDPMAKDNQRNSIEMITNSGKKVIVEQITGAIARRIACYVKEGQEVKTSQKIGMIYFGSQVALYLPKDAKVSVKEGDKVFAGETSLGSL
ncbi:MAG: phosphatidylserine decarboxylase [Elusimicrobia bacterium]|nr:phosphatidylserine decarboxylase [Elusimicrobiota bacterium]